VLGITERLAKADPTSAEAQRDVSRGLESLGDVLRDAGDLAGARSHYERSLEIAERLAKADPTNAQGQRDVCISLQRLGFVSLHARGLAGARTRYERSLEIRESLAKADPSNAVAQRDVGSGLALLGNVLQAAGDLAGPRRQYERSPLIQGTAGCRRCRSKYVDHPAARPGIRERRIPRTSTAQGDAQRGRAALSLFQRGSPDWRRVFCGCAITAITRLSPVSCDRSSSAHIEQSGRTSAIGLCWTLVHMTHSRKPVFVNVTTRSATSDRKLQKVIEDIRSGADAFVFLAGGASAMAPEDETRLLALFEAFAILVRQGWRIAVGDGGTQAGIMEASGKVRLQSGRAFPLIGVVPAAQIPPVGKTLVDPNHSHIVCVDDKSLDDTQETWGAETSTMYEIFARLARDRPSVTIVANGGITALGEVEENVRAGRKMILIDGSGRAADALVSLLNDAGGAVANTETAQLRAEAAARQLTRSPELFQRFQLADGSATGLARTVSAILFSHQS
jgi:hypothetical protein